MLKKYFAIFSLLLISFICKAQIKSVFNNNVTFSVPIGWYVKDSSNVRIMLRKTGDEYSKIEIKIYQHNDKDLVKYATLDKKKFQPDPHVRTIMPDTNIAGRIYKKVKYVTKNPVLKVDTDMEYVSIFKPKFPIIKIVNARLEIIITYSSKAEAAMLKVSDALVASFKY